MSVKKDYGSDFQGPFFVQEVATSKFLIAKFEKEVLWNGSDVYGFYEGTV